MVASGGANRLCDDCCCLSGIAAAFLADKAARRQEEVARQQEKATFTSALYAKQVDTLASLQAKANLFTTFIDHNRPQISAGSKEVESAASALADELINTLFAAEIVYPAQADPTLEQARLSTLNIKNGLYILHNYNYSNNLPQNVRDFERTVEADVERSIEHDWLVVKHQIATFRSCATPMLQNGKYVDGPEFSACLKSPPKYNPR